MSCKLTRDTGGGIIVEPVPDSCKGLPPLCLALLSQMYRGGVLFSSAFREDRGWGNGVVQPRSAVAAAALLMSLPDLTQEIR